MKKSKCNDCFYCPKCGSEEFSQAIVRGIDIVFNCFKCHKNFTIDELKYGFKYDKDNTNDKDNLEINDV